MGGKAHLTWVTFLLKFHGGPESQGASLRMNYFSDDLKILHIIPAKLIELSLCYKTYFLLNPATDVQSGSQPV